jgi:hypothetical protein
MITIALRTIAILIALAAILDPATTSTRRARPLVAVIAADAADDVVVASRVSERLAHAFNVVAGPLSSAAASVVVGRHLPDNVRDLASVRAPRRAPIDAHVPVLVTVHVTGARGRRIEVVLRAGAVALDRVTRDIASEDERFDAALSFVPTAVGASPLRATAALEGAGRSASADLVIDVHETKWSVLFHDARPSWMSTFVRRAIERDQRFLVTSRVVTSRDISTDAGQPPPLDDVESTASFDAIVIGAPETLRDRDVTGLETYLRRNGGSLLLLFDRRSSGPWERLTAAGAWLIASEDGGVNVDPVDGSGRGLRSAELLWPTRLPVGARPVAHARNDAGAVAVRPVVWKAPVGAGQLLVSGALDAWRFRDPLTSSFDEFWQTTLASAAAEMPSPIDVHVETPVLAPGATTDLVVTLRQLALAELSSGITLHASVGAALETPRGNQTVRLWPDGPGRFRGVIRAPNESGAYRVVISSDNLLASAPVIVAPGADVPTRDEPGLLAAWARANDGGALPAAQLEALPALLDAALGPERRRIPWHPMRSAWWIVPFALTLGTEWWLRRRRGLA